VRWYNHEHKHSGLKFVTPAQRRNGVATAVLAQREAVHAEARQRNPRRWSRSTRNWKLKDEVWLNPERMQPGRTKSSSHEVTRQVAPLWFRPSIHSSPGLRKFAALLPGLHPAK
jgi:hypothetical protein